MSAAGRLTLGRILGAAGWLVAGQAFGSVCALATTVVWARLMPAETFGEFKVLMGIIGFVSAFCLLGAGQASIMSAAKYADGNFLLILRSKIMTNLIASLALAACAAYYAWSQSSSLNVALALLAAAFLFPIYNTTDVWMAWINGKGRIRELALSRAIVAALGAGAIFVAAIMGVGQLWIIVLVYLGALATQSAVRVMRVLARLSNDVVDPSIITFSHHSSFAMAFTSLLSLDVVILNHVYSPQDVAIYVVALQFPDLLKRMYSVLDAILAPRIYSARGFAAMWKDIRVYFLTITAGCIAVGAVGFYLLPPLTILLFSSRYAQAAEYGRWLWLAVACCGATTLLGSAVLATKKPFFVYAPNIGYPICLAALFLLLVGDGVAGLTWARVIAVVALAAFNVAGFIYCLRASQKSAINA